MRPRVYSLAALLAIAALSSMPASAHAAKKPAWEDCSAHGGTLTQHYTIGELNYALAHMPTYIQEYSDCYSTIQAQLAKQLGVPIVASAHHAHAASDSGSGGSSTALIVAIAVVAVAGIGLALWATKRRGGGSPPPDGGAPADGPPPGQPPAGEPPPAA